MAGAIDLASAACTHPAITSATPALTMVRFIVPSPAGSLTDPAPHGLARDRSGARTPARAGPRPAARTATHRAAPSPRPRRHAAVSSVPPLLPDDTPQREKSCGGT